MSVLVVSCAEAETAVHGKLSPVVYGSIEPVGRAFMRHCLRKRLGRSIEQDEALEKAFDEANAAETENDAFDEFYEDKDDFLAFLDVNSKDLDHYAILGLGRLRYKATDDDIKRAYRRKVLKHHPDKNRKDDSAFKLVQKSWELLGNPVKRRQWDSIDPEFDEDLPPAKLTGDFFAVYGPVFEREARFSVAQPTPLLGDMSYTKEQVDKFYRFWFKFESWRTFELLDEESTDNAESRDEKRWLDRKNKAARAKRKKEDNARINKLVEQAMRVDPRLVKFKEDEKAAKEAKKKERFMQQQQAEQEAQQKAEQERLERERIEAEEKAKQEIEKKEREARKKAIKKEKKNVKALFKQVNYFTGPEASAQEEEARKLEIVFDGFGDSLDLFEEFRSKFESLGLEEKKNFYLAKYSEAIEKNRKEEEARELEIQGRNSQTEAKKTSIPWTPKEGSILIKAVKLFPGGTLDRWEKIADYVNAHGSEEGQDQANVKRTPDECIRMSKQLQSAAASEREQFQIASKKKQTAVSIQETPTVRSETEQTAGASSQWTATQQSQLEAALKAFPASMFTANPAERWEKVSAAVEGKSKKEVKLRVKELAEMVKKKKQSKS